MWHLNAYLEEETPWWVTKGKTVLIQKDKSKETKLSNYHPITCLHLTWKLLTGISADEIYGLLDNKVTLPEEQKGCRRKSSGTGDQLYIRHFFRKKMKEEELSNGLDRLLQSL